MLDGNSSERSAQPEFSTRTLAPSFGYSAGKLEGMGEAALGFTWAGACCAEDSRENRASTATERNRVCICASSFKHGSKGTTYVRLNLVLSDAFVDEVYYILRRGSGE